MADFFTLEPDLWAREKAKGTPTKFLFSREAGETVAASLEVIVGEDSGNLWHTLVSSKAISKRFPSEADGKKYVDSALESLTLNATTVTYSKLSTQCSVFCPFFFSPERSRFLDYALSQFVSIYSAYKSMKRTGISYEN